RSTTGSGDKGTIELLAQVTTSAVLHERAKARIVQRDAPRPMLGRGCRSTGLAGCLGCQLQQAGRQALDILRLVEGQRKCLGGVEDMIAKRCAEPSQFLVDVVKTLALLALQAHSGQFSVAEERIDNALLRRFIR